MLSEEETKMGKVIRVRLLASPTLRFEPESGINTCPEQAARPPIFPRTFLLWRTKIPLDILGKCFIIVIETISRSIR